MPTTSPWRVEPYSYQRRSWRKPLIVLTVVIHVIGLGLINKRVDSATSGAMTRGAYLVRMLEGWRRFGSVLFRPACRAWPTWGS